MTLHAAKGLEFETVFLPGWEEGLFPSQRTLDEKGTAGLEEERRLAYVGLTRAKCRVFVSFAANRRVHGQWQSALPSRFIGELPAAHVDNVASEGFYGNYGAGFRDNQIGLRQPGRIRKHLCEPRLAPRARSPRECARARPHHRSARASRRAFRFRRVRLCGGDARLPPEIRLWPHRRGGRQQAAGRFRKAGSKRVMDGFVSKRGQPPSRTPHLDQRGV